LRKKDLISELETMVPFTEHLHIHDSFGKFKTMDTYIFPEDITYGQGDIHLPLGWGDIPFEIIFSTLNIKKDIFFNFELTHRYKKYYSQNIKKAKKLITLIQ
jgi:sugar phosphate isomerase/epimerase